MPLQVGEVLCVDCSFGSAGGRAVPNTAAAGSRHRHPWLFQLTCGEGGQLEAQPSSMQHLKAFEVQLVSVVTGACEHYLRASFPASGDGGDSAVAGEERRAKPPPSVSNGGGTPEVEELGELGDIQIQMGELEQHISRQQHSVFWEEVFENLKAEALVDGKDGWLVHQDARCGDDVGATRRVAPDVVERMDAGAKRRLVSLSPRGTAVSRRTAGARVVHVLDDEVMVEMNSHFQLGYRLVSGPCLSGARAEGSCTAEEQDRSGASERMQAASLCQLALLYCGSLIRQQQRAQVVARRDDGSKSAVGQEVGARIPAGAAGGKVGNGTAGGHLSAASTWKSVRRVLLHHLFRSEVSTFHRSTATYVPYEVASMFAKHLCVERFAPALAQQVSYLFVLAQIAVRFVELGCGAVLCVRGVSSGPNAHVFLRCILAVTGYRLHQPGCSRPG